jgi:long-chain acyl-CoA synthetase
MPPEAPGRTLARLARQVELAAATADVSLPQYRLLILLSEGKEAASALADKLAVSRPSVTGVVDGLVARGLVERDHDSGDRRRVGHALTTEGRRVLAAADAEVERRLDEILAQRPTSVSAALAGLAPWQDALDAHRLARRGERARQAEAGRAARQAEAARHAQTAPHSETARHPETTRQAEAARHPETARPAKTAQTARHPETPPQ